MKYYHGLLMVVGIILISGLPYRAHAFAGQEYSNQAKVTMEQARAKALKAAPGTIQSAELEKEPGGSGLRYSFDIKTRRGLREVGIDAKTGKVLEDATESSQAESREQRAEKSGAGESR